jgi:predicted RNA-binding protein YlqC (UPF0109 family)
MTQTGATLRILPKSDLPPCAFVTDEVLLVTGPRRALQAALHLVASKLAAHPPRAPPQGHRPLLMAEVSQPDVALLAAQQQQQYQHYQQHQPESVATSMQGHHPIGSHHAPHTHFVALGGYPAAVHSPSTMHAAAAAGHEVVYKLVVPTAKAGNVIGKAGDNVQKIRTETGARVKIFDPAPGSDERLVVVAAPLDPGLSRNPAQDALVRCTISMLADEAAGTVHKVRLLAPKASVGALLGKRGATVTQLRQESGANVKVHSAGGAEGPGTSLGVEAEGDEVVELEGTMQQCIAAMRGVATLLQQWKARQAVAAAAGNDSSTRRSSRLGPRASPIAQQQASLQQLPSQHQQTMPLHGPSTATFYAVGHHPISTLHPFAHSHPSVHPTILDGAPIHPIMGSSPVMVPFTQVWTYHLSNAQVGAVIGRGGQRVTQVRLTSGARVQLGHEQASDGSRILQISGSPEACNVAHGLVNHFLTMEQCPLAYPLQQGI